MGEYEAVNFIIVILGGNSHFRGIMFLQYTTAQFLRLYSENRGKCEIYCWEVKIDKLVVNEKRSSEILKIHFWGKVSLENLS